MGQQPSSISTYAPPLESFPPAPRRLLLRPAPFTFYLFLIFALVGLVVLCMWAGGLAHAVLAEACGITVPGVVTEKSGRGKSHRDQRVTFTFLVNGEEYTSHMNVNSATQELVKVGDAVQVRVWPMSPVFSASIVEPKVVAPWGDACIAAWVLLWNGMTGWLIVTMVRLAMRRRRLLQYGTPTFGIILDKQRGGSKNRLFLVKIRYTANNIEREATTDVQGGDYDKLDLGRVVTVLFAPDHPEQAVIYRCAEFAVVGVE